MSKLKLILPLILLLLILVWAVPAALKAMPDRYVMRLPEPLQKLGLPGNDVALLPTVEHPVEVQNLLLSTAEKREELAESTPTLLAPSEETDPSSDDATPESDGDISEPLPVAAPATPIPLPTSTTWPLAAATMSSRMTRPPS